jgi:uncharacterized protein
MHRSRFWWLILVFMLLIDSYYFTVFNSIINVPSAGLQNLLSIGYWTISLSAIATLFILPRIHFEKQARIGKARIFTLVIGLFFAKLIGSVFFLADDIRRGIYSLMHDGVLTGRSDILGWTGMGLGITLLVLLIYGFTNKYRYKVNKIKLDYSNLPGAFRGLKVVHISDIHSGSFTNKEAVERGVDKIMKEQPDLILFTGDLVNNVAEEMNDYMDVFNRLQAPYGVFSTLGNHDYGDYIRWESPEHKANNLDRLKEVHRDLGWRLLINEHVAIEKDGEKIAIIGIENWSAKARFPSYGDLEKAYRGAEEYPFKILLSHDPSHWKAEVLSSYTDIDLTLAGHTHGMQFGFEIPWIKWSPVKHVYREWAGLYESEDNEPGASQKLYVNRGFGFHGYPGRVGILPEITVLELS